MNRIMIRGHEAIVRDEPPTQTHNEYPKHMTHPGFQPGVGDKEIVNENGTRSYVGGRSIRFPPVLVMNADQQAYQESQGYVVQGKSNPDAFARAMRSLPTEKQDRIEYPKWVGGVLCNSPEEEAAAAEKRRAQLGIKSPEADPPELSLTVPPEKPEAPETKTAEQQRIEALEAQIAEMNANMAKLLALVPVASATPTEPAALPEDAPKNADAEPEALTHGQKIAAGRARKAAERAAQPAGDQTEEAA